MHYGVLELRRRLARSVEEPACVRLVARSSACCGQAQNGEVTGLAAQLLREPGLTQSPARPGAVRDTEWAGGLPQQPMPGLQETQ